MTEATPFLQKYDITFLLPPTIAVGGFTFMKMFSYALLSSSIKFDFQHICVTLNVVSERLGVIENAFAV